MADIVTQGEEQGRLIVARAAIPTVIGRFWPADIYLRPDQRGMGRSSRKSTIIMLRRLVEREGALMAEAFGSKAFDGCTQLSFALVVSKQGRAKQQDSQH